MMHSLVAPCSKTSPLQETSRPTVTGTPPACQWSSPLSPIPNALRSPRYLTTAGQLPRCFIRNCSDGSPSWSTSSTPPDLWEDEDRQLTSSEHILATGAAVIDEHAEIDLAVVTIDETAGALSGHRFTGGLRV
jgi:hypothetical protein